MKHTAGKVLTLVLVLLLTVPFTTGCWDRVEIEQRATVLGLAVDVPEESGTQEPLDVTHPPGQSHIKPKVELTAHIAVPGRIPLGPGGSGGGGGEQGNKAIWTIQARGEDMAEALTNMQQQVAERIFLGHLRMIIVSEAYARQGIETLNDYFRRNSEIRRSTWLVVSKGRASDIMALTPPLERVPTLYLLATMDRAKDSGKLPNIFVGRFWTLVSSDGQEGYLPYVTVKQEQNLKIDGLAYFQKDIMVGTTTPFQIMALMQVLGENPAGYSVPYTIPGGTVVISAFRRLSRIHTSIENGIPTARVSMHVDATITESDSSRINLQDPTVIDTLQNVINKNVETSCLQLIQETQKNKADIFGFGENFRAKHPRFWQSRIKNKAGWEEVYPSLKVQIKVSSRIHRMGMKDQ
ncbi:Ger(x)C family spore germination protein [Alicyclobacillus mengziensis]|uniref:Ger(X)C family spore germination protein n=1 Tax=Alicyclobacillus mengziensis TaxID=2931921 RepID=A0A9X7VYD5_9BACL|nr:Ger(x)C family spore germination protein [Alicyclobacillus mengziensis]QSO46013.1 Ger(x)C family spore germination protein [Alicyclobacillus mengziensis]